MGLNKLKKVTTKKTLRREKGFFLICLILILAFFLRVYRIHELLGFFYDQGRDALVIWDLIHNGKFFLIGPTTGIAGIFRGPWYYWLITPFYFFGGGNPVYPCVFLSLTSVSAIYILYKITKKISTPWAAWTALVLGSFSYYIVGSSRWLSNPTPMYLISVLFIWSLFALVGGKRFAPIISGFIAGMAMQFGSATEVFYIPVVVLIAILYRKKIYLKSILGFIVAYFIPFIPQIIFDLRHEFILSKGVLDFLLGGSSFELSFWEVVRIRLPFYYDILGSKIFYHQEKLVAIFFVLVLAVLVLNLKKLFKNKYFVTVLVMFLMPLVGMLFFQGNGGNVYDYYFTGYYLVFILLVAFLLGEVSKNLIGKLFVSVFLLIFCINNLGAAKDYLVADYHRPDAVTLASQKEAIDWIYQSAKGEEFNVDVYVPPVIPYAYDYLFKWYGGGVWEKQPVNVNIKTLYTLFEADLVAPDRLEAWLKRQEGIGRVIREQTYGLITVQERERIDSE